MVLISRENKRKVFEYLLNEGVIVIKKEFSTNPHKGTGVPNLQAWMILRSLASKGIVELTFNWLYYYYYLKTDGVKFLRDHLGISEETVVPLTFKKTARVFETRGDRPEGEDRPRRGRGGGRGRGGRGLGRGRGGYGGRGRRDEGENVEATGQEVPAPEGGAEVAAE